MARLGRSAPRGATREDSGWKTSALRSVSAHEELRDLDGPDGSRYRSARAREHPKRTHHDLTSGRNESMARERTARLMGSRNLTAAETRRDGPTANRAKARRTQASSQATKEERTPYRISADIVQLLSQWGPKSRADLSTMSAKDEPVKLGSDALPCDPSCSRVTKRAAPSEPSVPGVGNAWRLPAAIVLIEPTLRFRNAADACGKWRAMLARESRRAGGAGRELGGIDMTPARDAVDMLARDIPGPARSLADQLLALTFGEAFG
jgi:hypothetical protein